MNNSMLIREAVEADIPDMMRLIRELAAYEKASDEVTVQEAHFRESGFGNNPVWWALIAVNSAGETVAFALYYIRYSTWKGQRMYLEDIIVTEAWRGKGIGKMLMDTLIEIAKAKGFSGMVWQVLDWNEPAINFYKKYQADFDPGWVNVTFDI